MRDFGSNRYSSYPYHEDIPKGRNQYFKWSQILSLNLRFKYKKTTKENLWQFQVHLFSLLTDGVKIANASTDGRLNRP